MKKSKIQLTTAQFAKLHEVNKRTLHYYDTIGLFSPDTKGDNGYRYYNFSQSIDVYKRQGRRQLSGKSSALSADNRRKKTDHFRSASEESGKGRGSRR